MSFLAPAVLWGLVAASIPLIIHLISTRRTQKVDFSSIRFIKVLEHDTIRKLKLRQWLLLLLRTVAIILIVLVFARPVKVGYFPAWAAGQQTAKLVFLLDNSASMSARFSGESLLERSKNRVLEILEGVEGKLSIDIYQTTPLSKRYSGKLLPPHELERLLGLVRETQGPDSLWEAVRRVLDQAAVEGGQGEVANREFFLFSDFPATVPEGWTPRRANGGESESPQWRYYLFPQPGIETNLTVVSVDVSSQLRLPDHLVTVVGLVANQASDGREDVPIQLYFEDERVGQVVADFLPAQPKDFVFQAFPNRSGVVSGAMRIPHDDYEPDNQRFFQFTIPTTIRCKVAGPSNEDLSFLTYALSSINKDSQFVQWTQVSSQSVTTLSLDGTDVLILVDPASLKTSLVDETVKFVQRGGGIIAFMGELSSAREKSGLAATLSFPRPEQLVRLPDGSFHEVETVDRRHPLFENFPVADLSGELPRVFSHVKVMPGETARELLVLSNGDPFFMELEAHNARILLFTVLPNLRWSDFPLRGLFVPLLHRMLVYLVAEDGMGSNFEVGTHVEIPLRRDVVSAELQMLKPSGGRTFLVPDYRKEAVAVMDMDEAGVYRLLADGRRVASFVANISGTENPAARLAIKELSRIFPGNRTRVVGWKDDAKASVVDARRGTELWRPFLAAMLIVLILETWLGRVRREKTET